MASSSVSQDDIDNDYEKNSRRSRIRTARARQINPSGSRADNNATHPHDEMDEQRLLMADGASSVGPASALCEEEEAAGGARGEAECAESSRGAEGGGGADDTSPKPMCRAKDKRALPPSKMHHANKGKQQRDRRKLREKRRSTGVVHLASTESTGGSTTGDDEGSTADAAGDSPQERAPSAALPLTLETRRNTQQNESIANSYRKAQEKLAQEVDTARGSGCSALSSHADALQSNGSEVRACASVGRRTRRDKSPSDLEADDENDHDSLNQSETGSGSNLSVCNLASEQQRRFADGSATSSQRSGNPAVLDQMNRENKRLANLLEEKDRRIHLLEYKVQQLMRDTLTISEEQSRLQKENTTLLRALSKLTKDKASQSSSSNPAPKS